MKKNESESVLVQRNTTATPVEVGKKILIADDDAGIRDILQIVFERAGYIVEMKNNGEDILKRKFILPDLFLIDKQLSGYNGLDICRYLKLQKFTKHVPVIMISASPDIASLSKEAGADSYIEKPFEIRDLLKQVDYYINASKGNGVE
jgi:DNA-binding response OmpR family regulator